MTTSTARRAGLALLLVACCAGTARACTVPVFRYALERWRPGPCEVVVFHKGPLAGQAEALVRDVEAVPGNLQARPVDLDGEVAPELAALWKQRPRGAGPPWAVLLYRRDGEAWPAWSGPPGAANVAALVDSPARRELVRRLAGGDSAVWLLLESGDERADAATEALLAKELPRLEKAIALPEQPPGGPPLLLDLPLKVSFSYLRVSRSAPAEAVFTQALLGIDAKLARMKGPVVFPVIGRCRALAGLAGDELTAAGLEEWATYLCGKCSCEVQEGNPGTDLPLAVDWEGLLRSPPSDAPARKARPAPAIPPGLPDPAPEPEARPAGGRPWLWVGAAVAGAVAVLTAGRVLRPRRPPHNDPSEGPR
jgi:hypothetical protein